MRVRRATDKRRDAGRLEDELRGEGAAFLNRVSDDLYGKDSEIEKFLKRDVFTYARYGM